MSACSSCKRAPCAHPWGGCVPAKLRERVCCFLVLQAEGRAVETGQAEQQLRDASLGGGGQDRSWGEPVSFLNYAAPTAHHPLSIGASPRLVTSTRGGTCALPLASRRLYIKRTPRAMVHSIGASSMCCDRHAHASTHTYTCTRAKTRTRSHMHTYSCTGGPVAPMTGQRVILTREVRPSTLHVCACVCVFVRVYVYVYVNVYVRVYVYVCVCVCICIYVNMIYIYICMYVYVCICIHIHIFIS